MNPKLKVPVTYAIKEPQLTKKPISVKEIGNSFSYGDTNSYQNGTTKTRQTSSSPAPAATKTQPVMHKDVGIPSKVRFPLRKSPAPDPLWNISTMCTDRDELIWDQDNEISKVKYNNQTPIQPVYQPHDRITHYHKRSIPQKTLKARPPNKTCGQIANIDLAMGRWNPIPDVIHPEHMKGHDVMRFGTNDYSIDHLARPSAPDRSPEYFRKMFRPPSPLPDGKMQILNQASLFSPRSLSPQNRATISTAPARQRATSPRLTREIASAGSARKSPGLARPKSASSSRHTTPRLKFDRSRATIQGRTRGPIPPLL